VASLFERLDRGRPPPIDKTPVKPHASAQRLLDWLQHWSKPTIRARDICIYGPRPRNRESAISSAEVLVRHGWLVPTKTRRYDSLEWQIVRRPIIRPIL
jgi:hypothetical protein